MEPEVTSHHGGFLRFIASGMAVPYKCIQCLSSHFYLLVTQKINSLFMELCLQGGQLKGWSNRSLQTTLFEAGPVNAHTQESLLCISLFKCWDEWISQKQ